MSYFKREDRYLVLKKSDIEHLLNRRMQADLKYIAATVDTGRLNENRGSLDCVVVEADWPEFEPTWQAIKDRVNSDKCEASHHLETPPKFTKN